MSETIIDYINKYGGIPFTEKPMNHVDSLVLCQLSYLKFDGMVPDVRENKPFVTIGDIYLHENYEKIYADERFARDNRALFEAALHSRRYSTLKMNCFINLILTENDFQTQFSAITFFLEDGTLFIAYRGTDETLIGWKEDINMAFIHPVPGQAYSVKYLNMVVGKLHTKIYLGGHSKGGNFAVYAAMKCKKPVQDRIACVYCMDGPGFHPDVLKECNYEAIADRTVRIVPHSSLVGMLLEMDDKYIVVKSSSFGILQHNPFSWQIKDGRFEEVNKVYHSSRLVNKTINQWVYSMEPERVRHVTELLFQVVGATDTDNLIDMEADLKGAMQKMKAAMKDLNEEDREMMKEVFALLMEMGAENMKQDIMKGIHKLPFLKKNDD